MDSYKEKQNQLSHIEPHPLKTLFFLRELKVEQLQWFGRAKAVYRTRTSRRAS
jgi:hypothetical protein